MIHYIESKVPPRLSVQQGDVCQPRGPGRCYIAHVCNDIGAWGAGVAQAIGAVYPVAQQAYIYWTGRQLGFCQVVPVAKDRYVINMVAQHGLRSSQNRRPFQDEAATQCLLWTAALVKRSGGSLHMPKIGCGLGGAVWSEVQPLIAQACSECDVTIYTKDVI